MLTLLLGFEGSHIDVFLNENEGVGFFGVPEDIESPVAFHFPCSVGVVHHFGQKIFNVLWLDLQNGQQMNWLRHLNEIYYTTPDSLPEDPRSSLSTSPTSAPELRINSKKTPRKVSLHIIYKVDGCC